MKVEFFNDSYPMGIEFDIGGLLFINGEEVEISDEKLDEYENKNGKTLAEALSNVQFATVDGKQYEAPEINQVIEVVEVVTDNDNTGDDDEVGEDN